jgi:hypothetical protein
MFNPQQLVGLNPEEITAAVRLSLVKQELQQRSMTQLQDWLYKLGVEAPAARARTELTTAQTAELTRPKHAVKLPDGTTVTLTDKEMADYQKKTGDMAEYEYYFNQETTAGRQPKSFFDWQRTIKESGATRISLGEKKELVTHTEEEKIRARFRDPGFEKTDVLPAIPKADIALATPEEARKLVWKKTDELIRGSFKGVTFGKNKAGQIGWFDSDGRLIRAWGG